MIEFDNDEKNINIAEFHAFLTDLFDFFDYTAANLEFEEIYATVFPMHLRKNQNHCKNILRDIRDKITDEFPHNLTALEEYVLYHIIEFVWDATEKTFDSKETSIDDLINNLFSDFDFLCVGNLIRLYNKNSKLVTDFLHIDLDDYRELMPPDILASYLRTKSNYDDKKKPNEIKNTKDLIEVTKVLLSSFEYKIKNKKWHKFINDGQEKHAQFLFLPLAEEYFKQYDVVVNPEVQTGRGSVDFYLVKGYRIRVLVEFKLSSHADYKNGIKYQIPTYLITEDCDDGIFVFFALDDKSIDKKEKLIELAKQESENFGKHIEVVVIDARSNLPTASNIKNRGQI